MIQFYFLGVALNILCGLALLLPEEPHPRQLLRHAASVLANRRFRIALGILGLLAGLLLVVSPIEGDVPLVGDLVPALTVALAGLVLLLESASAEEGQDEAAKEGPPHAEAKPPSSRRRFGALLLGSGKIIGLFAILAGILHFLFPLELFF